MSFLPLSRIIKLGLSSIPLALTAIPAEAATYITSIVASDLNNPRDLAFGPDGGLYITETGFSDQAVPPGTTFSYPSNGSITRVIDGVQTRIVTDLSSIRGLLLMVQAMAMSSWVSVPILLFDCPAACLGTSSISPPPAAFRPSRI